MSDGCGEMIKVPSERETLANLIFDNIEAGCNLTDGDILRVADALIAAGFRQERAKAARLLASAQGIVAAMRADHAPGPVFKALNEVIGVLEEMRRAALVHPSSSEGSAT